MMFHEELRKSLNEMHCTQKELAEAGNLPASTINRYISGKRIPEPGSEQLEKILNGLQILSDKKGYTGFCRENFCRILQKQLEMNTFDYERFQTNLSMLIDTLKIKVSKMTKDLYYETSYIQRIKSGQRRPAAPEEFAGKIAKYVMQNYVTESSEMAQLLGMEKNRLQTEAAAIQALKEWLCTGKNLLIDPAVVFLKKLDEFDMNEYQQNIQIEKLGESYVTFPFPTRKTYYGPEGMRKAEMNFIKITLVSESVEPSIYYSDMPLGSIFEDDEFYRRWVDGISLIQKKGLRLIVIHNLNRSFHELLWGMEKWLPIYMAGAVESYYLYEGRKSNFCHGVRVSGSVVLREGAIRDFVESGQYYISEKKEEVAYYNRQMRNLLSRAGVLMKVYREENKEELYSFLKEDEKKAGKRKNIIPSLPLYTLSEETLQEVIDENYLSLEYVEKIKAYYKRQKCRVENILCHSVMENEIFIQKEEQIHSWFLPVTGVFCEQELWYSAELYKKHLEETRQFADQHKNYKLIEKYDMKFRGIQISCMGEEWVMLSKTKNPTIHFVIQEPKLCRTVRNMIAKL